MKNIDLLNDPKYSHWVKSFRENKRQHHAATEIALINRFIKGDKSLVMGKDFSEANFRLIEYLMTKTSVTKQ